MMSNFIQNYFGIECFLLYYFKIENAHNVCVFGDCISQTPNQEMQGDIQVRESNWIAQTLHWFVLGSMPSV